MKVQFRPYKMWSKIRSQPLESIGKYNCTKGNNGPPKNSDYSWLTTIIQDHIIATRSNNSVGFQCFKSVFKQLPRLLFLRQCIQRVTEGFVFCLVPTKSATNRQIWKGPWVPFSWARARMKPKNGRFTSI